MRCLRNVVDPAGRYAAVSDAAMAVTAATIAATLGGAHRSGAWWRCRCPVHGSSRASLALRDGARGLIVRCWADCDRADIVSALRALGMYGAETGSVIPARYPESKRRGTAAE